MPKVSILLTTYNRSIFLGEAIASVQRQTYKDYELIIVDDGSTDGTPFTFQTWRNFLRGHKVFYNSHQGRTAAITFAQAQATGKYSIWLDSDDLLREKCLERLVEALDNTSNQVAYGWFKMIKKVNGEPRTSPAKRRKFGDIPKQALQMISKNCAFHPRLYDTQLALDNWLDTDLTAALDYDLMMRLNDHTDFTFVDEVLYYYRSYGDDRMSRAGDARKHQQNEAYKAQMDCLKRRKLDHQYYINPRNNLLVAKPGFIGYDGVKKPISRNNG